ncbi:MAG: ABC transporter substrate-binding protein [bacterium]
MSARTKGVALGAMTAAAALALSACGGSASTKSSGGGSSASGASGASGAASGGSAGGTIYNLSKRPVEHWDPQRIYIGVHLSNASRLFSRSLTVQPATEDNDAALKLQPDLATDTGTATDGGKTWKFTLKDGVKWQDGKDVTCDDVKYGMSRTFATDVITGGPNYILQYLDVPKDPKGGSAYKGPYSKVGQADFDKAITCAGKAITFHFNKPWADFNYATASLSAFSPFRKDQDKGDKSNFAVFSDGPYKLQGTWQQGKGGTFVRNDQWDAKTDPLRKALPDKFVFVEGLTDEVITQRLIADSGNDKFAITDRRVPPALEASARSQAKDRLTNPVAPYVDYLTPNFKRLTNPKVRQALAVATDKGAYITASGGATHGTIAKSVIAPSILGYKDADVFQAGDNGDPGKAKSILQSAGVSLPYPIKFTYSGGTPTTEKQAAVVKAAWEKAGFKVTLDELTDTYYDIVQNPKKASTYDVCWASWGADWPAGSTVIPALFDDRINLSAESNGQDYGLYASKTVDAGIDEALNKPDIKAQAESWAALDQTLAKDVAYIPLLVNKFVFLRGSGVKGYINGASTSTFPDLATIAAK